MSDPKYVFDTNIFIILKNKYPPDISIFAKLWEEIETLFEKGVIISSDEVIEEIEKGNDELKNWAKLHKNSFYSSDESIQNIVRDILQKFEVLVTKAKKSNGADPFVIALAKQKSCIVVTEEKRNGTDLNPKIPNICEYYNIKCIDLIDFLRENNF
jgi:predicted nucleic acid-binding protein